MGTTIAIHQPNFAPWPGFFYKIKNCDAFVILDDVDYQSGNAASITNRTKIKTPQGELFISVPVKKGATLIKDVMIDNAQPWRKKMLKTIQQNYTKAPYFNDYFPQFEAEINKPQTLLSTLNTELIKLGCTWLDIKTPLHLSSELGVETNDKNERIIEICKRLGGTTYLSGNGARKYNDEARFNMNGIQLQYTTFVQQPYSQLHGGFIPGLSVLDWVFNGGLRSNEYLH